MSTGWDDPIVGGVVLRIPAIQSPNYVTEVSGWTIRQNGSAEFSDGLLVSGGSIQGLMATLQSLTVSDSPLLVYGNATTVVTYLTGSGTWLCPAGVTSVYAEAWGSGGGGGGSGGGGSGGEYAAEPALAVTAGNHYAYSQGAAAAWSANGSNSTFAGDTVTVTAHGGISPPGNGPAPGGTGSTNTVHFNGGAGGTGVGGDGGGGGGSAGTSVPGNPGPLQDYHAAMAVPGGGPGGYGGSPGSASAPASGPGGGGGGATGSTPGGSAAGQLRVTYTTSSASALLASISAIAGTDITTGDTYLAGTSLNTVVFLANQSAPLTPTGGGYLYANAGNLYWLGSSGTSTKIASA